MGPDVRGRADSTPAPHSRGVIVLALLALALGGFAIGSTEFVALGLLPDIARELLPATWARSNSDALAQAGVMVSAYAAGVVVGAPTIAAFGARLPRKALLLGLLVAFVLATVATCVLPGFGLVVAARFVAGLPHGAYFGVATLAATELLGPGARGRAAAFVLAGLTTANVVGVPVITAIGQAAGWRTAYLIVAAAFALTFVAVLVAVPRGPGDPTATVMKELSAFARPQVWFAVALGAIGFGGLFSAYTYIAPITTNVTGLGAGVVPIVLVVFGIGMTIGNIAGGWFVDRGVRRAVLVCFVGVLASLLVLLIGASSPVGLFVGVLLIGVFSAALSPAIQVRLMDVARGSTTIAAASTHSALNIGNSLGAALGAVVIAAGLGYLAPIVVGVGMTALGLVIAGIAFGVEVRAGRTALARPDLAGPDA
ncbi:MFS transporter [uncultured Amnibacterium sp.]|uniref:MFS transporter n=1 Tax=uncultured Amnibacterium sp. TaxID=1631851 RepID=UPI0035CAFB63